MEQKIEKKVEIISKQEIFKKFIFRIIEVKLRHMKYNNKMSEPITRLNLDRGDSVAVLMHNLQADTIVLTEQFKYPSYYPDDDKRDGWMIELPAGIVEEGETAEDSARRELIEEVGYEVHEMKHISSFFLSPGGTSERIILFYCRVSPKNVTVVGEGGGLDSEGEDIKTMHVKFDDALKMVETGEIADAKTILGLQWLQLQRIKHNRFDDDTVPSSSEVEG